MSSPLLQLRDVRVSYPRGQDTVNALRGITLDVQRGECLAVVGESGSGKTQLCLACLGLLAPRAIVSGSARFADQELLGATEATLRTIRGSQIAMIFQDALSALTPHLRIGTQMIEGLCAHRRLSREQAMSQALALLERVQVPDARRRLQQYPHELSGGLRQRVLIAMALLLEPALVIADEPTTALDVSVQGQIVELLREVRAAGQTLVLITHDLGVVAALADRVAVMRTGELVELQDAGTLFARPAHAYTRELLAAVPRWTEHQA
ncbi:MAG TPA: ABC transporter ATP-binding protein [Steroidobacteraceae bacterium]|nr:ABC transporter ATP-binding protein [Steroidobacteraceae bacterium]